MREITSHIVDGDDKPQLSIRATDEPGSGGANHRYEISGSDGHVLCVVSFQNGGVAEVGGWNGVSHEALLAIVADRLTSFQGGPFAAQENATALSNVNNAQRALQQRTLKRIARGVEGKSVA